MMTLDEVLQKHSKLSFHYKTNNCLQFTNECWKAVYGKDYRDREEFQTVEQAIAKYGSFLNCMDDCLTRQETPEKYSVVSLYPQKDNPILGFCLGQFSVFLGEKGIKYLPTKYTKESWK